MPVINRQYCCGGRAKLDRGTSCATAKPQRQVAILSRGYKRNTRGFRIVYSNATAREVGYEPLQMKKKNEEVIVAVDTKRKRGIAQLLALPEELRPEVIVLDDAFQHRKVMPSKNILLIDYHRPLFRTTSSLSVIEASRSRYGADAIIITNVLNTLTNGA